MSDEIVNIDRATNEWWVPKPISPTVEKLLRARMAGAESEMRRRWEVILEEEVMAADSGEGLLPR